MDRQIFEIGSRGTLWVRSMSRDTRGLYWFRPPEGQNPTSNSYVYCDELLSTGVARLQDAHPHGRSQVFIAREPPYRFGRKFDSIYNFLSSTPSYIRIGMLVGLMWYKATLWIWAMTSSLALWSSKNFGVDTSSWTLLRDQSPFNLRSSLWGAIFFGWQWSSDVDRNMTIGPRWLSN